MPPILSHAEPRFQEVHGRGEAERGMYALSVVSQGDFLRGVERLDVVEQISFRFSPRTVAGAMHPFILQAVEE